MSKRTPIKISVTLTLTVGVGLLAYLCGCTWHAHAHSTLVPVDSVQQAQVDLGRTEDPALKETTP